MTPFRKSIQKFLRSARTTLSSSANTRPPVTIVVGNQSADLDSILSALVLAYTLQSTTQQRTYIPVTNLKSSDIPLRPELLPALSRARIRVTELITVPELYKSFFSGEGHKEGGTKWLLVDHNKVELPFSKPPWNITREDMTGCIDHHKDENYIRSKGASPAGNKSDGIDMRIIQKSGSCMSLIVNHARETGSWKDIESINQELLSETESENLEFFEAQTALIALAPILIDTANLKDASKTTETDLEAVAFLEGRVAAWETSRMEQGRGKGSYNRDEYYEELDTAKRNLEPLTLQQILRKDYKEWEDEKGRRVGISTVVKPLEWMVEKTGRSKIASQRDLSARSGRLEEFWDVVSQFVESRVDGHAGDEISKGLDVYSIMTASVDETSEEFKRELIVCAVSKTGVEALSSFDENCREKFDLEPMSGWEIKGDHAETGLAGESKIWEQRNLGASRKAVGPALREVLQSLAT